MVRDHTRPRRGGFGSAVAALSWDINECEIGAVIEGGVERSAASGCPAPRDYRIICGASVFPFRGAYYAFGAHSLVEAKVRLCEGFRTTAGQDSATGTGAVVRKRPGKEPAGS